MRRISHLAVMLQLGCELSWLVAAVLLVLRFAGHLALPLESASSLALVFALLIVCFNGIFGLYRHISGRSTHGYWLRAVLAPAIGIPLAYLVAEVLPGGELFREHIGVVGVFALGGLLLVRHAIVLPFVRAIEPRRVLVLGTGHEARLVEASLATQESAGISLAGFYRLARGDPILVASDRVVGSVRPLQEFARRLGVDEIIVAARGERDAALALQSLHDCRLSGIRVTEMAGFFERVHGRVPVELIDKSWLAYSKGYSRAWLRRLMKRTFDLAVATLLLIAALPVMAIAAAMIVLDSGMPVIYRQTRVGLGGRHFTVLKFRTMMRDAETGKGAQWAAMDDPRVTRVGRFMRRTRIDELPQLINVIRGEMSVVGPRPERPEFVAMLAERTPLYPVRHSVNPGITGWAQVRYSYGGTVEESIKKLEYDLYYVKNHSLALDLQILLETVRVVLLREGGR